MFAFQRGESGMTKNRLMYIDNIRLLVITLAVLMHIAVTYSGLGRWVYNEPGQVGIIQTVIFGFYQAFTQGFAMGIMFMIAGYFIPESYDSKGFSRFLKDRFFRLGVPTLIFMLIVGPITNGLVLVHGNYEASILETYAEYIIGFHFIGGSGPLWFAFALLIFSLIYALIRKFICPKGKVSNKDIPSFPKILLLIILMGVCTFLVRIVQPVGTDVFNMQLCHFSQYIIMFVIGLKCKRNNWLDKLDHAIGKLWFVYGLSIGFVTFLGVLILGGALDGDLSPFDGGVTWQSAAYSIWESFVAVSMSIGLVAVFKRKLNKQKRLPQAMSANAFAVYAFHAPIIVALTLLFAPVTLLPIVKFIIVAIVGVPICFLFTNFTIQKIPLLRRLYA